MDKVIQVQTLNGANGISQNTNNIGKSMNPIILPPTNSKCK